MLKPVPGPPMKDTVTMLRWPLAGYVGWPLIWISGLLPKAPSVFSVGPGVKATYGTGETTATASAISTPAAATSSVAARRAMGGDHARFPPSLPPLAHSWGVHVGTLRSRPPT